MDLPLIREPTLALVVLAGGRGRRIGGLLKPALRLPEGDSLLERTLRALGPCAAEQWVVAPEAMARALPAVEARWVYDPGEGPVAALAAACARLTLPWLMLVAADHPRPSAALVEALWSRREGAEGVVPRSEGVRQTLCALYARAPLTVCLAGEDRPNSLQAVCGRLRLREIEAGVLPEDARRALEDIDDPEAARAHGVSLQGAPLAPTSEET